MGTNKGDDLLFSLAPAEKTGSRNAHIITILPPEDEAVLTMLALGWGISRGAAVRECITHTAQECGVMPRKNSGFTDPGPQPTIKIGQCTSKFWYLPPDAHAAVKALADYWGTTENRTATRLILGAYNSLQDELGSLAPVVGKKARVMKAWPDIRPISLRVEIVGKKNKIFLTLLRSDGLYSPPTLGHALVWDRALSAADPPRVGSSIARAALIRRRDGLVWLTEAEMEREIRRQIGRKASKPLSFVATRRFERDPIYPE